MDKLQQELKSAGLDVAFTIVNAFETASAQDKLIERCSFPLFQDEQIGGKADAGVTRDAGPRDGSVEAGPRDLSLSDSVVITDSRIDANVPRGKAWTAHGGHKDDLYIYDKSGRLVFYLPVGGPVNVVLSDPDGYSTFKALIYYASRQ